MAEVRDVPQKAYTLKEAFRIAVQKAAWINFHVKMKNLMLEMELFAKAEEIVKNHSGIYAQDYTLLR